MDPRDRVVLGFSAVSTGFMIWWFWYTETTLADATYHCVIVFTALALAYADKFCKWLQKYCKCMRNKKSPSYLRIASLVLVVSFTLRFYTRSTVVADFHVALLGLLIGLKQHDDPDTSERVQNVREEDREQATARETSNLNRSSLRNVSYGSNEEQNSTRETSRLHESSQMSNRTSRSFFSDHDSRRRQSVGQPSTSQFQMNFGLQHPNYSSTFDNTKRRHSQHNQTHNKEAKWKVKYEQSDANVKRLEAEKAKSDAVIQGLLLVVAAFTILSFFVLTLILVHYWKLESGK